MIVQAISIDRIKPYENNPRNISDEAIRAVAESIRQYGFRQPIVVDSNYVIIAGHTRYHASKYLNLSVVPVHVATDLSEEQVRAYRIADNRSNEFAEWDIDLLQSELSKLGDDAISYEAFALDDLLATIKDSIERQNESSAIEGKKEGEGYDEIEGDEEREGDEEDEQSGTSKDGQQEEKYVSIQTRPIVYEPKKDSPPTITELYNREKADQLLVKINSYRNVLSRDIHDFLCAAAHRFIRFRFDLIAEYYCHSDQIVKSLFEDLALVIVDIDSAIERGFIKMNDRLNELLNKSKDKRSQPINK